MPRASADIHPDHLTTRSFQALAQVIEDYAGIKTPAAKQTMLEGRLRRRVKALGLAGPEEYAAYVLSGQDEGELPLFIDCVTTNKTDFFRESSHFTFLEEVAVPNLLQARPRHSARLKIWSAACSIGAEAYTIAMVLQDMRARLDFRYAILGTDISTEVLADAQTAIYPREALAPVPPEKRRRYVMAPADPAREDVRIVPELRRAVQFERLNLMDEQYPFDNDIDIIFCRNVLIYFDKPTQHAVVTRLASHLRPGGYLLLGHSESMAGTGIAGLRLVQPTVFQALNANERDAA